MSGSATETVVHAVGDVFVDRPRPGSAFGTVRGVLDAADVVFGNCEVPYTDRAATAGGTAMVAARASSAGLAAGGFTVMSCANNHVTDAGVDGMLSTLDTLRGHGIATAGAGTDLAEARRPAVLHTEHGATVAVVAYACYYRIGTEATADRAGFVPVGGTTRLVEDSVMCAPGIAPLAESVPNADEVEAMVADIEAAKSTADLVLASFHWGDAVRPAVLSDHEWRTARTAIDAGADAVFGHHHHVLRGIDVHRGKPIFYGLGNFVWDAPEGWADSFSAGMKDRMRRYGGYGLRPRPGYPRLPFHPDGRLTMVARCRFAGDQVQWFGFVPCVIGPDGDVTPFDAGSDEGERVTAFVRQLAEDLELPVSLQPDPAEVVGGLTAVRATVGAGSS